MRWASSIAPGLAVLIAVGCGGGASAGLAFPAMGRFPSHAAKVFTLMHERLIF